MSEGIRRGRTRIGAFCSTTLAIKPFPLHAIVRTQNTIKEVGIVSWTAIIRIYFNPPFMFK